jgi:uncharacterized protein with GYD domain
MPLYFVEHKHRDDTCPTQNEEMMAGLGQHVTQATADKYGVRIHSDVVHPGEHTLNLVLEADSPDKVASYMVPFMQVGSVMIKPVTTCEEVVRASRD